MVETSIVPVEVQQKAEETESMLRAYDNFQITTAEIYVGAGEDLKIVKAKWKELDTLRKSLTKPLDESKKKIMEFFARPLGFLEKAESIINSAMVGWNREQERIRRAEEERLLGLQRKETERLAKLAAAAEALNDKKKQEFFQERKIVVQAIIPVVEKKVEKVAGLTMTVNWKFRIVDVNKIPREYLIPDEVKLGQMARFSKGSVKIEGVEFYSEESIRGVRS